MAEAEALMAEIGSGDYQARQAKRAAEEAERAEEGLATHGLKLSCDVNGCVIVPIHADQSTPGLTGRAHAALSVDRWHITPLLFCTPNI